MLGLEEQYITRGKTEIPNRVNFDFLLVLFGVGLLISPTYFEIKEIVLINILQIFGGLLILIGINYLKYDYDIEMEIKELRYAREKCEFLQYFKDKKILKVESKIKHEKDISNIINK